MLQSSSKVIKEDSGDNINNENSRNVSSSVKLRGRKPKKKINIIRMEPQPELKYDFNAKNPQEKISNGKKIINAFLKIFEVAGTKDVKLSSKNNKYFLSCLFCLNS